MTPISTLAMWSGWCSRAGSCCLVRLYRQKYQYRMRRERRKNRLIGTTMPIARFVSRERPVGRLELGLTVE